MCVCGGGGGGMGGGMGGSSIVELITKLLFLFIVKGWDCNPGCM